MSLFDLQVIMQLTGKQKNQRTNKKIVRQSINSTTVRPIDSSNVPSSSACLLFSSLLLPDECSLEVFSKKLLQVVDPRV